MRDAHARVFAWSGVKLVAMRRPAAPPNWAAIGGVAAVVSVLVAVLAWWLPRSPTAGGETSSTPVAAAPISQGPRISDGPLVTTKDSASPSTSSSRAATVRHDAEVLLAKEGDAIDLNAPSSDRSWGAGAGGADTVWYNYALGDYLEFDGVQVATTHTDATFEICRWATNYADPSGRGQLDLAEMSDKPRLCLRLTSGRYAAISKVKQTSDSIKVHLTVWELP